LESKEEAEQHGLELCKDWIDKRDMCGRIRKPDDQKLHLILVVDSHVAQC
jgi:hypothetical protein